jgi:hypothetical protein
MRGVSMDTCGCESLAKRLSGIVQKEWEEMILNKYLYDAEHPDNKKNMSNQQMMQIARNKTMQELSMPECPMDETG